LVVVELINNVVIVYAANRLTITLLLLVVVIHAVAEIHVVTGDVVIHVVVVDVVIHVVVEDVEIHAAVEDVEIHVVVEDAEIHVVVVAILDLDPDADVVLDAVTGVVVEAAVADGKFLQMRNKFFIFKIYLFIAMLKFMKNLLFFNVLVSELLIDIKKNQ
jgi:hypothetical protein